MNAREVPQYRYQPLSRHAYTSLSRVRLAVALPNAWG
jgi:hypothetical protein